MAQAWTQPELETLILYWPQGGMKVVQTHLPPRSRDSIRGKVSYLQLKVAGRKPATRVAPSEFVDAAIRRAYLDGKPNIEVLSKSTGRHRGWLKWRAAMLGLSTIKSWNNQTWTEEEDRRVQSGIDDGKSISTIHRSLYRAGFKRSLSAVAAHVYKLNLTLHREWWTATDVADLFSVYPKLVLSWIDNGWLAATRAHGPHSLGDTTPMLWKIRRSSVRKFMLDHPHRWDHRKMNQEILIDLLAPSALNPILKADSA